MSGETAELKQRYAARVEKITELETVAAPAIPTGRPPAGTYRRAEVVVSWSVENFGTNLPTLVSTAHLAVSQLFFCLLLFTIFKIVDPKSECRVWSASPAPGDTASWRHGRLRERNQA